MWLNAREGGVHYLPVRDHGVKTRNLQVCTVLVPTLAGRATVSTFPQVFVCQSCQSNCNAQTLHCMTVVAAEPLAAGWENNISSPCILKAYVVSLQYT
jgi:hypothetical protein